MGEQQKSDKAVRTAPTQGKTVSVHNKIKINYSVKNQNSLKICLQKSNKKRSKTG